MAFELYPTPAPSLSASSIPFADNVKKFPTTEKMKELMLAETDGDQTVRSNWAYDNHCLYLRVETTWPTNDNRERAWRFGDGFLLTVSHAPADQPTAFYTTLGFGGPEKVTVVNSSGRWFPDFDSGAIGYRQTRSKTGTVWQISVPWASLPPIRPLCTNHFALNLTFTRTTDSGPVHCQLVNDPDFDSEKTLLRRVLPLAFGEPNLQSPLAQTVLTKARLQGDDSIVLRLGLLTPDPCPAELKLYILQGEKVLEKYFSAMELASGPHQWTVKWSPHRAMPSGLYILRAEGKGSQKSFKKDHPFYVLNPEDIETLKQDLERMAEDINYLHKEAVLSALFRLDWITQLSQSPPWEVPDRMDKLLTEARTMLHDIQAGVNPLQGKTGLSRRAFRSRVDGSLQPYSIYLPRAYSDDKKWPLLVFLHGSGVDEQRIAANQELHKLADRLGIVILFPRGRRLNGFYLDDCETDILEALEAVKSSVSVSWSRTFLAGFSMGGFGTWHTGLRHSHLFAGLAVFSGNPSLPQGISPIESGFDVTDFIETAKSLPLLVIHGANDCVVPVEPVRKLVEKLQENEVQVTFKEIKAGHSNYDYINDHLANWLKMLIKK
ncbi:MAG: hypothetical protein FH749_00790 [Firmicutes bacterium]|nr:hypothetical protein [Bacillota bacterium]